MKNFKAKLNARQEKARATLIHDYGIKPSSTLILNQTSVSRSGMLRKIKINIIQKNNIQNVTYWFGELMKQENTDNGVRVSGCGMNMHFWLADHLSYLLFGSKIRKGYKGNGGSCINWKTI